MPSPPAAPADTRDPRPRVGGFPALSVSVNVDFSSRARLYMGVRRITSARSRHRGSMSEMPSYSWGAWSLERRAWSQRVLVRNIMTKKRDER
jgi:hypothetical protein